MPDLPRGTTAGSFFAGTNLPGQSGWNYIYTTKGGWIDLPHFTAAANFGFGQIGTAIGGYLNEAMQLLTGFNPSGHPGTIASAFTYEDIPSNQLGALFRGGMNNVVPLSTQLEGFFTQLGAAPPGWAPNYSQLPPNEAAWVASQGGYFTKLAFAIGRAGDSMLFGPHYTQSQQPPQLPGGWSMPGAADGVMIGAAFGPGGMVGGFLLGGLFA